MPLADYEQRLSNWRQSIRRNRQKSRMVIVAFFIIYLLVGFCVDVFAAAEMYRVPVDVAANALLSLKIAPLATLIMFGVAGVSLLVTYAAHDKIMLMGTDSREITRQNAQNITESQLFNIVEELKIAAGLRYMPRVFIIDADYMNAFASGYSEKSAMVAITRGLLYKLNRAELTAVMAHEISHVRHLDIKLTLMVGVLSNILLIIIDLVFRFAIYGRNRSRNDNGNRLVAIILILRFVLPVITLLLTLFLSRTREYMADAGCVQLMRENEPLANALLKIHHDHVEHTEEYRHAYGDTPHEDVRRAAYLYDPVKAGLEPVKAISSLFSTHPPLAKRLAAIGFRKKSS